MQTTTMGLVLRATKTGEADRVLSVLTPAGIVSAIAKGSLRLKNRLHSATGLFCYSEFTLFEGKTMFMVDEAEVREVFWGVHEDVVNMALAMYCAEFVSTLSPTGDEAAAQLRLLLNSLYYLSEKSGPRVYQAGVRASRTDAGGLSAGACGLCRLREIRGRPLFALTLPQAFCFARNARRNGAFAANLDAAALAAMRHITLQ